ncbi:glutathione S-transferase, partial [Vibrio parahaemolyticus]|nr:glutathione S-transferase [Vibrio parahaemolyticus]
KAYQQKVLASESLQQWLEEANQETDIVKEDEAGEEV